MWDDPRHEQPAGVALHEQPHDFIHLDPFGSAAPHLDAAMSRAPHLGVVAVTATDTAALWGIYPAVARRHYGAELEVGDGEAQNNNLGGAAGQARRPPWFRELGVRVLLGAMARAAARHDRGIVPLSCLASDHFVQVCVRVQRGAAAADRSCSDDAIGAFWHCDVCDVAACGGRCVTGGGGGRRFDPRRRRRRSTVRARAFSRPGLARPNRRRRFPSTDGALGGKSTALARDRREASRHQARHLAAGPRARTRTRRAYTRGR